MNYSQKLIHNSCYWFLPKKKENIQFSGWVFPSPWTAHDKKASCCRFVRGFYYTYMQRHLEAIFHAIRKFYTLLGTFCTKIQGAFDILQGFFWQISSWFATTIPFGGRTKQPILNETKPPISKTRQNRRFRKWDKTADFKVGKTRRYCKRAICHQNCFSDRSVLA